MEVALRISGFEHPLFYQPDREVGQWHKPGAEGWQSEEGRAYVKINADGLRDREHTRAKPSDVFRIAILGDSFAEASQVSVEQTFWWLLGEGLNGCTRLTTKKVEVINFGVGDFGTAQELITLERRVWAYDPDVVLLAFFTGNDIRNNSRALEWQRMRPFFDLHDEQLVLDDSFARSPHQRARDHWMWRAGMSLSDHVRVLQALIDARQRLAARAAVARKEIDASVDDEVYREPRSADWTVAWRVTEALIARIAQNVHARSKRFVLVTLSNGIQVNPDPKVRQRFMKKMAIDDLFYPDKRLSGLAATLGIDVITLAPDMQVFAESTGQYLHGFSNTHLGDGHWNERAHRYAAQRIQEHLCASR